MTAFRNALIAVSLFAVSACERTPEQYTASAEKSAKEGAEQGHTKAQALGELIAAEGWARETSEGAVNGVAYLTIVNGTHNGDTLLDASASFTERTQIHRSVEEDGVARMEQIRDGLPIPSGATLKLAPGGLHIMLMGLDEPLKAGSVKFITLRFREAGEKKVPIIIRPMEDMNKSDDTGASNMQDHAGHDGE